MTAQRGSVSPEGAGPSAMVREVVRKEVAPHAATFDAAAAIPRSFLDDVVAPRGWWGALTSREYGGEGTTTRELGYLHEEVGSGCSGLRSLLTVHTMVAFLIERVGSAAQKQTWLPSMASGATLATFCLSEDASSSDFSGVRCRAELKGGTWTISGTKAWVTGGLIADIYLVFARQGDGIAAFLVPSGARGLTVTAIPDLLGTRASTVARLVLDEVRLPRSAVMGECSLVSGFLPALALDLGRFSVAAGCAGIVSACLRDCVSYTSSRVVDGELLSAKQLTKQKLADMVTALSASRALRDVAAAHRDDRTPGFSRATWIAKYYSARQAAEAASMAVQLHGAVGCAASHAASRHYRDAKVMEIIEGSTEVQQLTIGDFTMGEAHQLW